MFMLDDDLKTVKVQDSPVPRAGKFASTYFGVTYFFIALLVFYYFVGAFASGRVPNNWGPAFFIILLSPFCAVMWVIGAPAAFYYRNRCYFIVGFCGLMASGMFWLAAYFQFI